MANEIYNRMYKILPIYSVYLLWLIRNSREKKDKMST